MSDSRNNSHIAKEWAGFDERNAGASPSGGIDTMRRLWERGEVAPESYIATLEYRLTQASAPSGGMKERPVEMRLYGIRENTRNGLGASCDAVRFLLQQIDELTARLSQAETDSRLLDELERLHSVRGIDLYEVYGKPTVLTKDGETQRTLREAASASLSNTGDSPNPKENQ